MNKSRIQKKVRKGMDETIFYACNTVFLITVSILFLYPIIYVFSASLSKPVHLMLGDIVLFPKGFTFDSYKEAIRIPNFWLSYWNSIHITAIGTIVNMFFTVTGAYVLSKRELKGRTFLIIAVVVVMWFDPGLIPRYLNFRSLHLINKYTAVILGFSVNTFNLIILKSFFETVPKSLEESARIDGAGQWTILRKIYIPLSSSALTTVALFYAVSRWNGYFWTMILLTDDKKAPLQVLLKKLIVEKNVTAEAGSLMNKAGTASSDTIIYAVIVLSIIPIMLVYPYVQKFFRKGITLGAVKG